MKTSCSPSDPGSRRRRRTSPSTQDNEEVQLPGSVRLEVKVLASDTAVYLDHRTRSGVKNVHVLEPQGGGWTWRQAQHRARPDVNIAFAKEARPQIALIFLRPWRRAPAPPAPGRVPVYKEAQHACTLCISPPDRKGPGSPKLQVKGPGPFLLTACCVVWLAQVKDPGSPTPFLHALLYEESKHTCDASTTCLKQTHPGWKGQWSQPLAYTGPGPRARLNSIPCVNRSLDLPGPGPLLVHTQVTGPGSLHDRFARQDPGSLLTCLPSPRMSNEQLQPSVFLACMQLAFDAGTFACPSATKPTRARPLHVFACVRVGEASNPGPPREDPTVHPPSTSASDSPKPPREITIVRTSPACRGDSQVLRLGSHGEKWLWAVHALPPLRVASRPTESLALDLWISKHGHEITPESLEAARQLLEKWVSYNGPGQTWRDGRKRALSQPADPKAKKAPPQRATSNPPQQSTGPARRQRKKGPSPPDSLPTTAGPPEVLSPPGGDTQDYSQPTQDELDTWKCIWDLAAKPLVTDRHLPREYVGLWQQVCLQVLREQAAPNDMSPCVSDLFFVLPKLILCRPPGAESRKDRLARLKHHFELASQGEWDTLMEAALARPDPIYEHNPGLELAASKDGLSAHTQRLYKAASQGQLGKAWRQLRAPPPLHIGQAEWAAAAQKLFPHESTEGPPLREDCHPASWQPTEKQFQDAACRLKKGRAADSGGWTTELAQGALSNPQVRPEVLKWLHGLAICLDPFFGRQGLTHYHKLVCLDKGGGGVRPILIGMIWTKLVSHLLLAQARPDLEPFLKGKQFGIGTPQGGLAMTLTIRARLAANPTHVVASLDFKNAFGTLTAQRLHGYLAEAMSPVPSLAGCCECLTGQANHHQQPHGKTCDFCKTQALQNMGRTPPGGPSQHALVFHSHE